MNPIPFTQKLTKQLDGPGGIRALLKIAFPTIISSGSDTVMLLSDRFLLSLISVNHMNACAAGGLTTFMLTTFFMGIMNYINALVAQHYGAGKKDRCPVILGQALLVAMAAYPLLLSLIPAVNFAFTKIGIAPEQLPLQKEYFSLLSFLTLLWLFNAAFSAFFTGLGRTRIVMISRVCGMLLNIPVTYVLIFGVWGLPELGMTGAVLGTLAGNLLSVGILLFTFLRPKLVKEFSIHRWLRLDGPMMRKLFRFALPSGTEMFLNLLAFNTFILLFHSYGTTIAAAATIAINGDMLFFIPMIGLNIGITSLVGQNLGAGRKEEAERAAWSGLKTALVYVFIIAVCYLVFTGQIVKIFMQGEMADPEAVFKMGKIMLRFVTFYIIADAISLCLSAAIRGGGDTRWAMTMSVILHYVFIAVEVVMIKVLKTDPLTSWTVFIIFIFCIAIAFAWRFHGGKWKNIKVVS